MAAGRSSTGISPRPILMGAPRNALRAFNAGVSLSSNDSSKSILVTVHGCQNHRYGNGLYMSDHSNPSFTRYSYSSFSVTSRRGSIR